MPIKNFSSYLIEENKEVYFTFGRMNPPTIGHGKVMDVLASKSGKSDYKVYLSQSVNPKKDPLTYADKVKHTRKMFPKHARQVMLDKNVRSVFDIAVKLYDQGYTKVNMVVGADRIREFEVLLAKYNGTKARHGFYKFQKISIISAGQRDPDATGVEGMSASKQRDNASKNDYTTFSQGVPKGMSDADTRKLFNDVRNGMGLKEEHQFSRHIQLETVSETREAYVQGSLFAVGDEVVIKDTDELATVAVLGTNYVIIESDGKKMRKWLDAVELVEGKTGAQRLTNRLKKSGVDLDKRAKERAASHAALKKKYASEDADDKFGRKKGMGFRAHSTAIEEDVSQKELNDLEKFADRLLNKFDVDIEFTRHFADRMNDKRNKPAITIAELQRLFKKMADNKGKKIKKHGNSEAILKDMQSDLNLPVVINWKNGEFEVVNKTIMRKKAFKSPDPELKYEGVELDENWFTDWVAGLGAKSVQKSDYAKAAKWVEAEIKKSKGRHGADYYAQELIRKSGAKMNRKQIVSLVSTTEAVDHMAKADKKIDKEVESDKKKHDRILDRARLARARQKNRSTK